MEDMKKISVLIPAYQPDERLVSLVGELKRSGFQVVVVNDGSDESCEPIFSKVKELEAKLLHHVENCGKGIALKTGLREIYEKEKKETIGVITADADGQHSPIDIKRLAQSLLESPEKFFIGSRILDQKTPLRSRVGNALSRQAFRLMTNSRIYDTQSGLRAFSIELIPNMLEVSGSRYEYEMNVLLQLRRWNLFCEEIEIETIYINNNQGSHFRGCTDALRVFSQLLRFGFSSLLSFGVDFGIYSLLLGVLRWRTSNAYVGARLISAAFNYTMNKKVVFSHQGNPVKSAVAYAVLAMLIMTLGARGVDVLSMSGINPLFAKIVTDSLLFIVSFFIQQKAIFKQPESDSSIKRSDV